MKTYKALKEQYGNALAKQIRDNKKALQLIKKPEEEDYWQSHPEVDSEDKACRFFKCSGV